MRQLLVVALVAAMGSAAVADDELVTIPTRREPRRIEPGPNAKAIAISSTVVTGALFVTTVIAYEKRENLVLEIERDNWRSADDALNLQRHADEAAWRDRMMYFGGATLVSAALTGYLWTRTQTRVEMVNVAPSSSGATVSFAGQF